MNRLHPVKQADQSQVVGCPDTSSVGAEARRLVELASFRRSDKLCRLLVYLAERSEAGDVEGLSETAIGEQVFGRRDFDPRIDTIVRVQAHRLRQKLNEHYNASGNPSAPRLVLSSHPYLLSFASPEEPAPAAPPAPEPRPASIRRHFVSGMAIGALLATAVALVLFRGTASAPKSDSVLAHPIWKGIAASPDRVVVAFSTPLFVRTLTGYIRDFRVNDPDSIALAKSLFGEGVYGPSSDPWVTLSDLHASHRLLSILQTAGLQAAVVGGREISDASLLRSSAILIGHPRGIPWLVDAVKDLDFHYIKPEPGQHWGGLFNRKPAPGESANYNTGGGSEVQKVNEAEPDYALYTRRRTPTGATFVSISGNRARTTSFMVERLTDPAFLAILERRVGSSSWEPDRPVQLLFKVHYVNRDRLDAAFLTGRYDGRPIVAR